MFRKCIQSTKLTEGYANECFPHIYGDFYYSDETFVATLRALLSHRIKDGETVQARFRVTEYSKNTIENNSETAVMNAIYNPESYSSGTITITDLRGNDEDLIANHNIIDEHFLKMYKSFVKINKVTDFFRKTFNVSCYVNEEDRKVSIFVDNLNIRRMHYLQCAIFAFLPWYFKPEEGVTEEEMNLIQSLREKDETKYLEAISAIADKFDFRSAYIRNRLKGFERNILERGYSAEIRNYREIMSEIEGLKGRISISLKKKEASEMKALGYKTRMAEMSGEDSELMEYFLCNHKLNLMEVNNTELTFIVKDYLTYFDEDMAKSVIDNHRSYVYEYSGGFSEKDIEKVMKAIFIDQILKLRFCCAYTVRIGDRVDGESNYEYGDEYITYMPNPHIDRYRCLGNYERTMTERLMENDTIGAIEQCISSCKSLNFGDSAVMEVFMDRFCNTNYIHSRCIELPDGDVVNIGDAIEWLNKQEEPVKHDDR